MILKLRIYGLWRPRLWLIYNSNPGSYSRPVPTPRNRPSNSSTNRITNSSSCLRWRCIAFLSCTFFRGKNRRSPRTTKSNCFYCFPPRCILRTMFWNLRRQSQLYTNCSWSRPTRTLRKLIFINTRRRLTRKLIIGQSVGLLSQSLVTTDHL